MPDSSSTKSSLRFRYQWNNEPARYRAGTHVQQSKFILTDKRDADTVVCLVIRKRTKPCSSDNDVAKEVSKMAQELETDLRDIAKDFEVFE